MRRIFILLTVIVCVVAVVNVASADFVGGINFLSAGYSASGGFEATIVTGIDDYGEPTAEIDQDSYSFSQSDPIDYDYTYSHTCEGWSTGVWIGYNSGHLSVDTYAGVYAPWGLPGGVPYCDGGWVNSYTTGTWDFQPQYTTMELQFDIDCDQGWGESIGSILLQNLTTGDPPLINEYLDSNNWYIMDKTYRDEIGEPFIYSVDPAHTYRLTLSSRGSSYNCEGYLGGGISADIYSVPEPATISLLAIGGLVLRKGRKGEQDRTAM